MDAVTAKHLWYTRRGGVVRGPFPSGQITRYVLLGRLRLEDELSHDRQTWLNLREVPELIPAGMRPDATDIDRERLELLRRHEDERSGRDRRELQDPEVAEQFRHRRRGERRAPENYEQVEYRHTRNRLLQSMSFTERYGLRQASFPLLILVILLAVSVLYTPPRDDLQQQCAAAPAPGINWNSCSLEGANFEAADLSGARLRNTNLSGARLSGVRFTRGDLAYAHFSLADLSHAVLRDAQGRGANFRNADLSHADLGNADLSYANFSGANLGAADLSGARLDHAIWIDQRECAPGSVGECLAAQPQ